MESSKRTFTRIVLPLAISQVLTAVIIASWTFAWLHKSGFELVW